LYKLKAKDKVKFRQGKFQIQSKKRWRVIVSVSTLQLILSDYKVIPHQKQLASLHEHLYCQLDKSLHFKSQHFAAIIFIHSQLAIPTLL
jgi:hypothetical protein